MLAALAPAGVADESGASPSLLGGSWTRAALDPSLPVSGSDLQRVVVSGIAGDRKSVV